MAATIAQSDKPRILMIGAHPDDCEHKAAGSAYLWAQAGYTVRMVSATDGGTGHHEQGGRTLVERRHKEAQLAAERLGVECQILPIPNGELEATLVYRRMFTQLIREFDPDLVITHRPNDYHPDHRYTAQLVQDSAYVVAVPNNTPLIPAVRRNPIFAYFDDTFKKPCPFEADVVIDIDDVVDQKLKAMTSHVSQYFEWLPWTVQEEAPEGETERLAWLREKRTKAYEACADRFRDVLIRRYGEEKGSKTKYAEAYEISEYGSPMTEELEKKLFPF